MNHTEWTAAQESVAVLVDGHELDVAFYREGSGPPVILLHGIPTWSFLWRDIVSAISSEYEVVVPDMVGYGNSSTRDGFDRSIRAQEVMLGNFTDAMGYSRPTLVGHDIGGGVAVRYAAHNPESVDRLVLSNATVYDSWPIESIVRLGLPTVIEQTSVGELRATLASAYRNTLTREGPVDEFVNGMLGQIQSEEDAISMGRNATALNTNHTTEIDYGRITADTLLLWGADDDEQPMTDAERLQEDLQRATVVGLEGANHWVTEDRPAEYQDKLRAFLV